MHIVLKMQYIDTLHQLGEVPDTINVAYFSKEKDYIQLAYVLIYYISKEKLLIRSILWTFLKKKILCNLHAHIFFSNLLGCVTSSHVAHF